MTGVVCVLKMFSARSFPIKMCNKIQGNHPSHLLKNLMSDFSLEAEPHRTLLFKDIMTLSTALVSCPSHTIMDYLMRGKGVTMKTSQLLGFSVLPL